MPAPRQRLPSRSHQLRGSGAAPHGPRACRAGYGRTDCGGPEHQVGTIQASLEIDRLPGPKKATDAFPATIEIDAWPESVAPQSTCYRTALARCDRSRPKYSARNCMFLSRRPRPGWILSPYSRYAGSFGVAAGQLGSPAPFGLPVLTNCTQAAFMACASARSASDRKSTSLNSSHLSN